VAATALWLHSISHSAVWVTTLDEGPELCILTVCRSDRVSVTDCATPALSFIVCPHEQSQILLRRYRCMPELRGRMAQLSYLTPSGAPRSYCIKTLEIVYAFQNRMV
jgi:hypothetical protein